VRKRLKEFIGQMLLIFGIWYISYSLVGVTSKIPLLFMGWAIIWCIFKFLGLKK
jgi:hypothetical protein